MVSINLLCILALTDTTPAFLEIEANWLWINSWILQKMLWFLPNALKSQKLHNLETVEVAKILSCTSQKFNWLLCSPSFFFLLFHWTVINLNNSLVCTSPNFCNREFSLITGKTLENQNTFQFYFSGCGWKAKSISWESSDILWIKLLDKLMFMMFGEDFFEYVFDEKRTCHVHDGFKPQFVYNRHEWNCEYENMISNSFGFTSKMQGKSDIIWWGRFIDWANNTQLYSIPICSLAYFA